MRKHKRRIKLSTKIKKLNLSAYVFFSIGCLLVYTITGLIFTACDKSLSDTLTSCFFATFGGEILSCALIKIFKLRESNDEEGREYD